MGDAVISAVTQLLVNKLDNIVYSESQYIVQFEPQLRELKEQLQLMHSFLIDANKHKHKLETVKQILNSLRELIYEADDVVVDCQTREDRRKMKGSPCCGVFSFSEMIFFRRTGKKLMEINKEIAQWHKNHNRYLTPITGDIVTANSGGQTKRWTSQDIDQSEIVGLAKDATRIKGWILHKSESSHRIGIVGMGGLGKTTLAKKIFNDTQVMARYKKRIWISISQHVDEIGILKSILNQLGVKATASESVLLNEIRQKLSDESYVIVMDDVWSTTGGWWDRIFEGLPKTDAQSSCIIITSRNADVVQRMGVVEARIHKPKVLDEEESWTLFCKVSWFKSNENKWRSLEEVGKEIVRKCHGLPLAIKATGGLLAFKSPSLVEWRRVRDNFHEKLASESDSSLSVMASLQLSYDELPPQLKYCMLCFSLYPEDHEIDAGKLVHWWIGEGFVSGKATESATELAFNFLSQLISRCLVESVERRNFDGRVYSCRVHDLVRDLTIKIAREEAFCTFDGRGIQMTTTDSRRLGVTKDTSFQTLGRNKLRTLILTTFHSIGFDRNIALANVMSLRVLDLSHLKLDGNRICLKDLWGWITSLRRLAYLNLSNVAKLTDLPDSIQKLWGLQILILRESKNLTKLPASIQNLLRLSILDVGSCPLRYLPRGFSRLVNLQELYGFKIIGENAKGCHFGELKAFTQLRVLQLDITNESTIDDKELTTLEQLEQLRILSINAGDVEDSGMLAKLDMLSPPRCIEELYLRHFYGDTTPAWVNPEALPQLLYLCIESSGTLTQLSTTFWDNSQANWKVEVLCLKFLPRLKVTWTDLKKVMTIRYLEVSHCNSLVSFPCDVTGFGSWRYVEEDGAEGTSEDIPGSF